MSHRATRRDFNRLVAASAAGCVLGSSAELLAAETKSKSLTKYDLTPTAQITNHVKVTLEVGGDLLTRKNPTDPLAKVDPKANPNEGAMLVPMSVHASLEYDERHFSATRSARHYQTAEATIKTGDTGKQPKLSADRRLMITDVVANDEASKQVSLYSPAGPLSRQDLDLVDVIGCTTVINGLLPTEPVAEGDEWIIDADVMGPLLGLDSVAFCEVTSLLDDGNAKFARFQFAGTVHGTVDGSATEFDVRAIGLFSRERKQITQVNLAIREDRKVGPATPGFKGVAKARIALRQIGRSAPLAKIDANAEPETQLKQLALNADQQGFRLQHDRGWYLAGEERQSVTLRRVDRSQLVAQSTFTTLPPKKADRQVTLEQFEKDIRFSLGNTLGELVSTEQWTNPAGCQCLGLVARGEVQGVPVEWRYYLAAPAGDGHSISLATTVEQSAVEDAGQADRDLVNALELVEPKKASKVAGRKQKVAR